MSREGFQERGPESSSEAVRRKTEAIPPTVTRPLRRASVSPTISSAASTSPTRRWIRPRPIPGSSSASTAPITFYANTFEGNRKLTSAIDVNGTASNVTATNNVKGAVSAVTFVASGYPSVPTSKLSAWGPTATLAPGAPPITYEVGDLVMFDAELYRAKTQNTNLKPPDHPEAWEQLAKPADDLRVAPGSPYVDMGIR